MPRLKLAIDTVDVDGHDDHADRQRATRGSRGRTDLGRSWSQPLAWLDPGEVSPTKKRWCPDGNESFKFRHCRAFIGPTVSGGRHRNHCPLCL